MNSTRAPEPAQGPVRWLLGAVFTWLALARGFAAEPPMPRPPELERDVQFWIRVYTEIDTNAGFLHDQYNLAVVYDTLHFAPSTSPRERERLVEQARGRYSAALRRIAAASADPLAEGHQRIKEMWGEHVTPAPLREADQGNRFQLGEAGPFRAGV